MNNVTALHTSAMILKSLSGIIEERVHNVKEIINTLYKMHDKLDEEECLLCIEADEKGEEE